jgi:hypothetical protein
MTVCRHVGPHEWCCRPGCVARNTKLQHKKEIVFDKNRSLHTKFPFMGLLGSKLPKAPRVDPKKGTRHAREISFRAPFKLNRPFSPNPLITKDGDLWPIHSGISTELLFFYFNRIQPRVAQILSSLWGTPASTPIIKNTAGGRKMICAGKGYFIHLIHRSGNYTYTGSVNVEYCSCNMSDSLDLSAVFLQHQSASHSSTQFWAQYGSLCTL